MKQWIRIVIYAAVFLCIGALLWYLNGNIREMQEALALQQEKIQNIPAQASRTAMLKKEFAALQERMAGVYAQAPVRDSLPEVIATISALAVDSGVSAQVPTVQQNDLDVPEEEVFSDVRIHIVASGDPAKLAAFLYRIEHLPYMIHIASWSIDTTRQVAVVPFSGVAPEAPGSTAAAPRGSSLEADIVIVTRQKQ